MTEEEARQLGREAYDGMLNLVKCLRAQLEGWEERCREVLQDTDEMRSIAAVRARFFPAEAARLEAEARYEVEGGTGEVQELVENLRERLAPAGEEVAPYCSCRSCVGSTFAGGTLVTWRVLRGFDNLIPLKRVTQCPVCREILLPDGTTRPKGEEGRP